MSKVIKSTKLKIILVLILNLLISILINQGLIEAILEIASFSDMTILLIPVILVLLGDFCIFLQIKSLLDLKDETKLTKIKDRYKFMKIFYIFYPFAGFIISIFLFGISKLIESDCE